MALNESYKTKTWLCNLFKETKNIMKRATPGSYQALLDCVRKTAFCTKQNFRTVLQLIVSVLFDFERIDASRSRKPIIENVGIFMNNFQFRPSCKHYFD